jgi:hypothetical protein
MARRPTDVLDQARQDADLSHGELFLRYFELGGMSSSLELEAFCYGALRPSAHDYEVIAHALNERFSELGRDHPVAYSDDDGPQKSEGEDDLL